MSFSEQPINLQWDGEAFIPANGYWARKCDDQFVVGERYALVGHHERSPQSHAHYFAALHEYWQNLPEHLSAEFPNDKVLRAHALIHTGFSNKRQLVCGSAAEAERIAAFMKPTDPLAIVTAENSVVTEWTAESQSMKAMGKVRFQESKTKVLEYCASLVGARIDEEQAA